MLAEIVWDKQTLSVVMALGIPMVAIIAHAWYKVESLKSANNLKRNMVERGMSAEDIERVIKAAHEPEK
jgi:hypothetical protein